jgi:hypothetical protein
VQFQLSVTGKIVVMPAIPMFYGILIRIFFYDTEKHNMPHFHAEHQGHVAGALPPKKHKLVVARIEIHQAG